MRLKFIANEGRYFSLVFRLLNVYILIEANNYLILFSGANIIFSTVENVEAWKSWSADGGDGIDVGGVCG